MEVRHGTQLPGQAPGVAILVVDGDEETRSASVLALEPLGHTIVEARSGEAALSALRQRAFAVILMEVELPGISGYEVVERIRMRSASEYTPLILMASPGRDEPALPIAYASGATDFVVGPVDPGILRAKVSAYVDLFDKTRRLEQAVSHARALNQEFRDSEVRTRAVLEHVADGIVTITSTGLVETVNRAAVEMFGYDEDEVVGSSFALMLDFELSPESRDELTILDLLAQHVGGDRSVEWFGRRKGGGTFPMSIGLSDVQLGDRRLYVACMRDESEQQTYTEALRHRAMHDELTALPNRVLFADRANQAISATARSGEPLALMVLDLDGFKGVNDTLGHHHGDVLLQQVGRRLVTCLRESDTVARLGGDEFGVLLPSGADVAGAATVVWKIQRAFAEPFVVLGQSVEIGISIGIALVPVHGDNIDDLLRRADLAMYDAKRSGSGFALFAMEQEDAPARRLAMIGNLRECIGGNQLVLHYQPKIDLTTDKVMGVEALIRWNHPSGKLLMPDAFMPEVERNELIVPITDWVMNEALRQLRAWRDAGYDLTMAVNISARCLAGGADLIATADELTRHWRIPREKLTFELTESALIDTSIPGLLERLGEMDERLSIDDFGTGYSSLVYLQRLPVVELKIDRSFVMSLSSAPDDAVIVRSIIDLAHNLGVKVVAEGVEDAAALALLVDYGCDAAQGYYFSRPMTAAAAARWFETSAFGMPRVPAGAVPAEPPRPLRIAARPPVDPEKPTIVLRLLEIASALSPAEAAVEPLDDAGETAA
jgi:diguanylate cyclase (GGDEF)-like protein/PAS domain S-box-containing protein